MPLTLEKKIFIAAASASAAGMLGLGYIAWLNGVKYDRLSASLTQTALTGTPTPDLNMSPTETPTPEPTATQHVPHASTFTPTPSRPTTTPSETPTQRPQRPTRTPSATETPSAPDRKAQWSAFWPDTPAEAANMFGGNAADWEKNTDWPGTKSVKPSFGVINYKPIEWKLADPNTSPYYWPKTPQEAADYFFPGQNLDPRFIRRNDWGAWELMQDHWITGTPADLNLKLHRGEVAEGYTVNGDDKPENDRAWVAFGGVSDFGVSLSAEGQGMTIWPPGTDPQKIALEWAPFTNTAYYRGPNNNQLGPDPINFIPIYDAPGYITFIDPKFKPLHTGLETATINGRSIQLGGGYPATFRRAPDGGKREVARQKNPFKGTIRF